MTPRDPSLQINNPCKFQGNTAKGNGNNFLGAYGRTDGRTDGRTKGKTKSPAPPEGEAGDKKEYRMV